LKCGSAFTDTASPVRGLCGSVGGPDGDCSHYVCGALMKHNTSGSAASMMHVT
jgi:hypothetical protein